MSGAAALSALDYASHVQFIYSCPRPSPPLAPVGERDQGRGGCTRLREAICFPVIKIYRGGRLLLIWCSLSTYKEVLLSMPNQIAILSPCIIAHNDSKKTNRSARCVYAPLSGSLPHRGEREVALMIQQPLSPPLPHRGEREDS